MERASSRIFVHSHFEVDEFEVQVLRRIQIIKGVPPDFRPNFENPFTFLYFEQMTLDLIVFFIETPDAKIIR